jgi:hypothetical protein
MGLPKRKNNIQVYGQHENEEGSIIGRRKELLERITKSSKQVKMPKNVTLLHKEELKYEVIKPSQRNYK